MWAKAAVLIGFGLAVWAFCGALIGIGRQFMSMDATLIVHAIGAPLGAAFFSWLYHRTFGFTRPVVTAASFVAIALALDVFVVALLIEKSLRHVQRRNRRLDPDGPDLSGDLADRLRGRIGKAFRFSRLKPSVVPSTSR